MSESTPGPQQSTSEFHIPNTSAEPDPTDPTPNRQGKHRKSLFIGLGTGAAALAAIAAGFTGAFGGDRTAAVPASAPSISAPEKPGPTPHETSAPVETPSAPATTPTPAETTTSTPEVTPSEEPTPEKPKNEVLTNENVTELSPELVEIYDSIADTVQMGDLTYEQYLKLTDDEKALVEQALLNRAVVNGSTMMDTSICSSDGEDPECDVRFASKQTSNKHVISIVLQVSSASGVYTTDGAMGLSEILDPEASRILGDAPFYQPHNKTAYERFGSSYAANQKVIESGEKTVVSKTQVDIDDPDKGNGTVRIIGLVIHKKRSGDDSFVAECKYVPYEVNGKTAAEVLGLKENQTVKGAQWKLVSTVDR